MPQNEIKSVRIVYYSGTGNTRKVARCFETCLKDKGIIVQTYSVTEAGASQALEEDLLLVVYAVHALNAPGAVEKWIAGLPYSAGKRASVVSVSGGGEVCPNTACRRGCIRRLMNKGFTVVYEEMLVMPSNWIVATHEGLAVRLLEVLPAKVGQIFTDILSGVNKRKNPLIIDSFLSVLCKLERRGARQFGKRIRCSEDCNGCGICSRNCPAGNIEMKGDRPAFGNSCHLCLNCLYSCPKKALTPGIMKFVLIKEGYSLKALEQKIPWTEPVNVEESAKGFLWYGIRKYLLDKKR